MEQADSVDQPSTAPDAVDDAAALQALLRWYVAMGVDASVDDAARDAFAQPEPAAARGAQPTPQPAARIPAPAPAGAPLSADALIRQAEALAAAAGTLDALAAAWAALPGCDLAAKSTGMIFAGGRPGAALMLVGGAPDSDDERAQQAFAGAKGRLLDAMLRAIGLTRDDAYLAHVVPWRPPGNRPPTPLELSLCLPFARRQVALARPQLILCLGERAAQPLLGSSEPVSRLRGRLLRFEGETSTVKTLVTFSLDYLLKQPLGKRRAWSDLQSAAEVLGIGHVPATDGGATTDRLEPAGRD